MLRVSARAPEEQIVYDRFFSHDCSIHVDREIAAAQRWGIAWKRLPWPHFVAVQNPVTRSILDSIFSAGW